MVRLQLPPAPPAFAREAGAGEGCRAEVRRGRRRAFQSGRAGFGSASHFRIRSSIKRSNPLSAGRLRVRTPSDPPFYRSVAQSSERPAWDREAAGGNPAVPTNFNLLPWPNTLGIRLLSGTMQVEILPAAPLPGGVKVARRPVKPFGVGASPTLAANFRV